MRDHFLLSILGATVILGGVPIGCALTAHAQTPPAPASETYSVTLTKEELQVLDMVIQQTYAPHTLTVALENSIRKQLANAQALKIAAQHPPAPEEPKPVEETPNP